MQYVSPYDQRIATLEGHIYLMKKGIPSNDVPQRYAAQFLSCGCVPTLDADNVGESLGYMSKADKLKLAKKIQEEAEQQADDSVFVASEPEPQVAPKAPASLGTESQILKVQERVRTWMENGEDDKFTAAGVPNAKKLTQELGFEVPTALRDQVWQELSPS